MHSGTGGSNPSYSSVPYCGDASSKAECSLGGVVLLGLVLPIGCRTRFYSIDGWERGRSACFELCFFGFRNNGYALYLSPDRGLVYCKNHR